MNFLEELAAEWYEFGKGCFIRRNERFGEHGHNEMDVIACHPGTGEFVHIEATSDTRPWKERLPYYESKFNGEEEWFKPYVAGKCVEHIILLNDKRPKQPELKEKVKNWEEETGIKIVPLLEFIGEILAWLKQEGYCDKDGPEVPEKYPLLRAMQYLAYWQESKS